MDAEMYGPARGLLNGLFAIYRPALQKNNDAQAIFFNKILDLDYCDLETVVSDFEGDNLPSPAELRRLVQTAASRRKTKEREASPIDQEFQCPACHGTGFVERITEKGNTAAQRCIRNGYHALANQVDEIEAENRTAMANAIFTLARQIYGEQMSEFDRWMFGTYGTTRLFELSLKQLASVRRGLFETASRPAEKSTQQAA